MINPGEMSHIFTHKLDSYTVTHIYLALLHTCKDEINVLPLVKVVHHNSITDVTHYHIIVEYINRWYVEINFVLHFNY